MMMTTVSKRTTADEPIELPQKRRTPVMRDDVPLGGCQLLDLPFEILLAILNLVPMCMRHALRCQNKFLRDCVNNSLNRIYVGTSVLPFIIFDAECGRPSQLDHASKVFVCNARFTRLVRLLHLYPQLVCIRILDCASCSTKFAGSSDMVANLADYDLTRKLRCLDVSASTYSWGLNYWITVNNENIDQIKLRIPTSQSMMQAIAQLTPKCQQKIISLDLRSVPHSRAGAFDSDNTGLETIEFAQSTDIIHLPALTTVKVDKIATALQVVQFLLDRTESTPIELKVTIRGPRWHMLQFRDVLMVIAHFLKERRRVTVKHISDAGMVTRISTFSAYDSMVCNYTNSGVLTPRNVELQVIGCLAPFLLNWSHSDND